MSSQGLGLSNITNAYCGRRKNAVYVSTAIWAFLDTSLNTHDKGEKMRFGETCEQTDYQCFVTESLLLFANAIARETFANSRSDIL